MWGGASEYVCVGGVGACVYVCWWGGVNGVKHRKQAQLYTWA